MRFAHRYPPPEENTMFEAWICKEEPSVTLVVRTGASLPADLGKRDWTLSGAFEATPAIAQEISEKGFYFVTAAGGASKPTGLQDAPSPADPHDFR